MSIERKLYKKMCNTSCFNMALPGEDFILRDVYERTRPALTRTVTSKAEEKSIGNDNHVQPAGHLTVVKNLTYDDDTISGQLISLGGTRMEEQQTWGFSQDLMSRSVEITRKNVNIGEIQTLKSIQLIASHKNRTTLGSVIPKLMNPSYVDLEAPESNKINLVIHVVIVLVVVLHLVVLLLIVVIIMRPMPLTSLMSLRKPQVSI